MVISRTPLRVSFVGGGTDLPSFSRERGGAVLSTAIDKYVHVIVSERFEDSLRVSYSQTEIVETLDDLRHELVREALRMAGLPRKVEILTIADVPAQGTGLGSSSAVTVGALNALFAYQGILKSAEELAAAACEIEIDILGKPIGRQDQYACAYGGIGLLRFGPGDSVRRDPAVLTAEATRKLERSLLMFYTGRQRAAVDVLGNIDAGIGADPALNESLERMRDYALSLHERLGAGDDPDVLGRDLHENWALKRTLSDAVSTPEIDRLYEAAREAGALGGKLLGAGGGGFLLLYVSRDQQPAVRRAMSSLRELPIKIGVEGSSIVHVSR
jgi:D-glycero-alpha-D-manno-heptose-7-phosphate kinase